MALIERALHDPSVDVAKLEKLMELAERAQDRDAKKAYFAALVMMKPELPVIDRKGKIEVREKTSSGKRDGDITQSTPYAKWEDIDEKITPILNKHGFALTFRSGVAQDGKITVTGVLSHRDGHSEETTITLPHDSSGSKNAVQAVGSSTSYGKRYTATLLLNIRTRGEDDDGGAGGADAVIDEKELEWLQENIAKTATNIELFCQHFGIGALTEMTKRQYPNAVELLNLKARKKKL